MIIFIVIIYLCNLMPLIYTQDDSNTTALLTNYKKKEITQFFSSLNNNKDTIISINKSIVDINTMYSIPDNQTYSRCQYCSWDFTYDDMHTLTQYSFNHDNNNHKCDDNKIQASSSQWHEFFYTLKNDNYFIKCLSVQQSLSDYFTTNNNNNMLYIDRPVFILPIITFHVGHILVDLIEQLYSMMIDAYGIVRKDCLILLDVAGMDEREVLQYKINLFTNRHNSDSYGILLTYFTDLPILSVSDFYKELREMNKSVVLYRDIHIGLNLSYTHYSRGYTSHPCLFRSTPITINRSYTVSISQLTKRYQEFQRFLWLESSYGVSHTNLTHTAKNSNSSISHTLDILPTWSSSMTELNILFIQRSNNRIILNLETVTAYLSSKYTYNIHTTDLEQTAFSQQIELFCTIDVLIAVAGTSFHNVLFMRPGTVVVIYMQAGWCKWAWMYANQARLLGIRPVIICSQHTPTDNPTDSSVYTTTHTSLSSDSLTTVTPIIPPFVDTTGLIYEGINAIHWARKAWLQGPRGTKSDDIFIDQYILETLLITIHEEQRTFTTTTSTHDQHTKRTFSGWYEQWYTNFYPSDICLSDPAVDILQAYSDTKRPTHPESVKVKRDIKPKQSMKKLIEVDSTGRITLFTTTTDTDTTTDVDHNTSNTSNNTATTVPPYELYISSVAVKLVDGSDQYLFHIVAELVATPNQGFSGLFGTTPTTQGALDSADKEPLICLVSITAASDPWCVPIDLFNYYAKHDLYVTSPVHTLHLWLERSLSKIEGSDAYVSLDARIDESGGFDIHKRAVNCYLEGSLYLTNDVVRVSNISTIYAHNDTHIAYPISLLVLTKRSIQQYTRHLCTYLHFTSSTKCATVSIYLTKLAYLAYDKRSNGLNAVQVKPTPAEPFVFLHVDKCAGTTLRE